MYALTRQNFELLLLLLAATMVYLTFSPQDESNFWMYWATVTVFIFFGYLIDVIFSDSMSFVFDPNADNWRRKTDPQS